MNDSKLEYDRFGPWIMEISELDPPPPLFLPYLTRAETPLLSIKIPRKIDRRAAKAGMNLYDYLVTLYEDDMVILERAGEDGVGTQTFAYDDIQFMRLTENLLLGNLHLGLRGRVYDLPFNTVGKELMARVVDLIRARYLDQAAPPRPPDEAPFAGGALSFLFAGLLGAERKAHPERRVLVSQPEAALGDYEQSLGRRLLFGALDKRLLESLHLSDGRELKIISRGKTYKYRGQAIYGIDTCHIPLANLRGHAWEMANGNTAVQTLTLQTAGGDADYTFLRDNPALEGYGRFLGAVGERVGVQG
jgi:hypothetical protein